MRSEMDSGIATHDSLATFMHAVAAHSRTGTLSLTYPERAVQVLFFHGNIVEACIVVEGELISPAREVLARLAHAFTFSDDDVGTLERSASSYEALFSTLTSRRIPIDEVTFRRIVKHRILDRLYELDFTSGAVFSFADKTVTIENRFAPALPVNQVLLDIVALQADSERFRSVFGGWDAVARVEVVDNVLSAEEKAILEILDTPLALNVIHERAMLSRFHFEDALLSLFEKGLLRQHHMPGKESSEITVGEVMEAAAQKSAAAASVIDEISERTRVSEILEIPKPIARRRSGFTRQEGQKPLLVRVLEGRALFEVGALLLLLAGIAVPVIFWAPLWAEF